MKKKKLIIVLCLILVCAVTLVACSPVSDGAITNGGFDELRNDRPANWSEYKYSENEAKYKIDYKTVDPNSDDKEFVTDKFLKMEVSDDYGVYQLRQNVKLKEGLVYKLTYSINIADDITNYNYNNKVGVFVGILEGENSKEFYNSSRTDTWKEKNTYIQVENSGTYTFAVGMGLKDKGVRGIGMVDNIELSVVDSAPAGLSPVVIENAGISDGKTSGVLYTVFLSLFTMFACVFVYYMLKHNNYKSTIEVELNEDADPKEPKAPKDPNAPKEPRESMTAKTAKAKALSIIKSPYAVFSYCLIGMFMIRFLISYFVAGMADQLQELGDIALKVKDVGMGGAYGATSMPISYGMLYILAAVGGIADVADLSSTSMGMFMLLRLPQLVADLVTFYLIYSLVGKSLNYKQGALVAGLFAVLPTVFSLSATWGMNASIPLAFIVGTVFCMTNKNYIGSIICAMFAIIFNIYAIIILPVLLMFLGYYLWKEKNVKLYVLIPLTLAACIIAFYCLALPFTIEYVKAGKFFFLFDKMGTMFKANVLLTNNVFNFYAIFGLGNAVTSTATQVVSGIIMIALIGAGGYLYLKSRNRLDWIGLAAISFIAYSVLGVGASFEMITIGIVLLLIYAVLRDDKRLYKLFSGYALLYFINIGIILTNSGVLGDNPVFQALFKTDWTYILGSIITLIMTVYYFIVTYDIMANDYYYEIEPMESFKNEVLGYKEAIVKKFKKKK